MAKKLVLLDKLYNIIPNKNKQNILNRYQKYVLEKVKGFQNTKIHFNKLREYDKRMEISIKGPEEVFMKNLIKKEIGFIHDFNDLTTDMSLKGNMVEVGKVGFGIFVDCGVLNPGADVLLSLHTLREQLCKGNEKSLPEIIKGYNFIDHFPVNVKITSIDDEKNKIKGELEQSTLKLFDKLLNENIEAVFSSGETKGQFKKALERSGHFRDIVSIQHHGFLENIVILKNNTDAPGIIADIGKRLTNCKLSAIRPKRIKKLFIK